MSYTLDATIVLNHEYINKEREKLGRFIIASNDTDLSPDRVLADYKGEGAVEGGFRFLKDKSIVPGLGDLFQKELAYSGARHAQCYSACSSMP